MAMKGAIEVSAMTELQLWATVFKQLARLDPMYPLPAKDRRSAHSILYRSLRELRNRGVQLRLMA